MRQARQAFAGSGGNPMNVIAAAVQASADYRQSWQGLRTLALLLALQPGTAFGERYPLGCYAVMAFIVAPCLYLAIRVGRRLLGLPLHAFLAALTPLFACWAVRPHRDFAPRNAALLAAIAFG